MLACLINGMPITDSNRAVDVSVNIMDRGLQYGDGLFETMRVVNGQVRFWEAHFARLLSSCERLAIPAPDKSMLEAELASVIGTTKHAVAKLILTRGVGGRGYRPAQNSIATRIISLHELPVLQPFESGIAVRWCETRLARHAQLAGLKHLNRLEQVLAQNEWHDNDIAEGLMMDTEGELVCATAANVFIVNDGVLVTPDLKFSGIRGVMRSQVLTAAQALGIQTDERSVWPDELLTATEVFVTNAVRGIRCVTTLDELQWGVGPVACMLAEQLKLSA
jgi:4-amino-4-deoxychorismate lyase